MLDVYLLTSGHSLASSDLCLCLLGPMTGKTQSLMPKVCDKGANVLHTPHCPYQPSAFGRPFVYFPLVQNVQVITKIISNW